MYIIPSCRAQLELQVCHQPFFHNSNIFRVINLESYWQKLKSHKVKNQFPQAFQVFHGEIAHQFHIIQKYEI